ncbi:MAG: hypothetical protein KGI08_10845 [Thaumarchaeota archaeon]|nr:hypothetical protein [Nitrososphaerota archaeon]
MSQQLAPIIANYNFIRRLQICGKTSCHKCKIEFKFNDKIKVIGKHEYRKYYHVNCYKEY